MAINNLEKVNINGAEQWLLVRGKRIEAPLLIHIQAGPGLPIIPEANVMKKLFRFEENYIVAYWDQRACGKSFNKYAEPKSINFSQLADDIISCTTYLLNKYKKKKAIIIGYSIGATLSLIAGTKNNKIFERLFLVGTDVDIQTANKHAISFAISNAKNKKKQLMLAEALNSETISNSTLFQKRAKLIADLGGIKINTNYSELLISTISNMLLSKAYRLSDILKTIKGIKFCQNALLPELDTLNLFDRIQRVDLPVHFIHGKQDGVAPYQTAFNYYQFLQADKKTFNGFDNAAHLLHYDEPEKFAYFINETMNLKDN